ncbi:MAG TPA: hypothetical protein VFH08_02845 [Chitinophagaceae bacterium]|nr:hypothetical protein [Chitinophagaceae bacterium]
MEVHSHTHTPRKKWTHYFWEFLMLFLAVFCGFLAENQREHYIEHQRAKVYAASMKANLQVDTAELKQIVHRGTYAANYLDTFLLLLSTDDVARIPSGKLYWYGLFGGYLRGFQPNDATFQQMKSSGSLRYFSTPSLEQKISNYDQLMRSMQMLTLVDQPVQLEVRKLRAKIFDFRFNNVANTIVRKAVYEEFDQSVIDSFIRTNPPLLSFDKPLINEYAELCRSRNLRPQLRNANDALVLATEIIEGLTKKYHLSANTP